jgi:hypothetical protein
MIHFGGFDPIHLAAPEIAETAPLIPAHAAPAQFSNCSPVELPSAPLAPSVAVNPLLAPASPERDTAGLDGLAAFGGVLGLDILGLSEMLVHGPFG